MSLLFVQISSLGHSKWFICPNTITIATLKKRYERRLALTNPTIIFLYDPSSRGSSHIIPDDNMQLSEFRYEGNVLRLFVLIRFSSRSLINIKCKTNFGLPFSIDVYPDHQLLQLRDLIFKKFPEWNDVDDIEFRNSNGRIEDISKKIIHIALEYRKLELKVCLISEPRYIQNHSSREANKEKIMELDINCEVIKSWENANYKNSFEEAPTEAVLENIGSAPEDLIGYLCL
ncbi:unnamed protein product [Blepharisma stoltei]|uniref:Uncharacterized protein n=1 Tax=Blepharisma stoltei TaxID=1481888 RepID=A0AAU9JUD3_9CILI|nr:unnamed protein product [Blepharisma stoltei]